jgi:hypothetical protein
MPVYASWDNPEKTVIALKFEGDWTWDEAYQAVIERNRLIDSVDNKVDIIVNFGSAGFRVPPNAITHTRNMMSQSHERIVRNVIIGFKPMHIALWKVIEKVYESMGKKQMYFLSASIDDARATLAEMRQREALKSE